MKKFFKALALVLALTLVIGTIPAAAATTIDPAKVLAAKSLYVKTSKGVSNAETKATTWGYKLVDGQKVYSKVKATVSYAKLLGLSKADAAELEIKATTSNPNAVKVSNKKQKVTALAMGTSDVVLTVGGVSYTVKVTVKQSSDTVIFGREFKDANASGTFEAELGRVYEISVPRTDTDGKLDTDERRLFVYDSEGKDITADVATADATSPRLWTVRFTMPGDYKIVGEAYQSKNYNGATASSTINVKVNEGEVSVLQSAYNAFTLTFATDELAELAKKNTEPSLKEGYAAVTENPEIIKVFKIGSGNEKIATFIEGFSREKNVLTVSMFADLEEDATYQVEYQGKELTFKACKWIPASISCYYTYTPNMDEVGGTAKLGYVVYAVGEKNQNVNITNKVKADGVIEFSDGNPKNDYTTYTVSAEQVDFYKDSVTAPVHAEFTYYHAGSATTVKHDFEVTAKDNRKFGIVYYDMSSAYADGSSIVNGRADGTDPADKRAATISADEGNKAIRVRIAVDMDQDGKYNDDYNGDGTVNNLDYIFSDADGIKFVTSNADKLVVEESTGVSYAPKKADDKVAVYVYYRDKLVDGDPTTPEKIDPIYVDVYAKKTLDTFTVELKTDGKYSYSTIQYLAYDEKTKTKSLKDAKWFDNNLTYAIDEDYENFKFVVKDQFGNDYSDVTVTVEKVTDVLDYDKDTIDNVNAVFATKDRSGAKIKKGDEIPVLANSELAFSAFSKDNAVRTITFKATAEDNVSKKKLVRTFSFTVKNTTESTVVSQVVENVGGYVYRVVGKDSAGYKVCGYYLDSKANVEGGSGRLYVGIFKNNDSTAKDYAYSVSAKDKTVTLNEYVNKEGGGLTKISAVTRIIPTVTSGSAVSASSILSVAQYKDSWKTYIESTSYSVKAYKLNNAKKLYVLNSLAFNYAEPNQYKVEWRWDEAYSENTDPADVMDEAFRFDLYEWAKDARTGWTWGWAHVGDYVTRFSNLKNGFTDLYNYISNNNAEVYASYADKDDSVSFLYLYWIDSNGVIKEVPLVRSVYTGVVK